MKPDLINLILVCLYISIYPGLVVSYKKCCPAGQHLDDDKISCIENYSEETISTILANSKDLKIESTQDGVGFPTSCTKLEHLKYSNLFSITKPNGKDLLSTPKYKEPISEENFCIDTYDQEIYAVTCDQCDGKLCINLCCPFGHKLKEFGGGDYLNDMLNATDDSYYYDLEEGDMNPCEPIDNSILQTNYQLNFMDGEVATTNFKFGVDYLLVGPLHKEHHSNETIFECPFDQTKKDIALWDWVIDHESRELALSTEGVLSGVVDHLQFRLKNSSEPVKFIDVPTNSFCVGLKQVSEDQVLKVSFQNCKFDIQNNACENVRWTVFNIGFIVSIIFIIGAIIAHLIEPQLRDSTIGKISMMYLVNLLLQFIIIIIDRFSGAMQGTRACETIGYLLQYFSLSYYCWVSALAIFFFYDLKGLRPRSSSGKNKMFYGLCAYAQGFPLLICSITAIVDAVRKYEKDKLMLSVDAVRKYKKNFAENHFDAQLYPEMGVYRCYVGSQRLNGPRPTYFLTPEFLYVQMYQLLILMTNLGMFIKTAIYILQTRQHARNGHEAYHKENFLILVKLMVRNKFVYMLCVWILEIATLAIAAEHGINNTCPLRLVLDLPYAFHGLITILFLVCLDNPIGRFYIMIMKRVKVALSLKMWSLVRTVSELFSQGDSGISTNANNIETMTVPETNLEGVDNITLDNIP